MLNKILHDDIIREIINNKIKVKIPEDIYFEIIKKAEKGINENFNNKKGYINDNEYVKKLGRLGTYRLAKLSQNKLLEIENINIDTLYKHKREKLLDEIEKYYADPKIISMILTDCMKNNSEKEILLVTEDRELIVLANQLFNQNNCKSRAVFAESFYNMFTDNNKILGKYEKIQKKFLATTIPLILLYDILLNIIRFFINHWIILIIIIVIVILVLYMFDY
ncbi:hypothetical protein [Marinitoga litoralis]|uniref:hypothetical protein n=1 Tax=Marinitoga litoralis TaxID=570855 RepID=UPI00195F52CB|nr:hypothetical protein [Marinitoga litoralis]MBM7559252.1 hypothetical protein [Marinitoga litoralis]